MVENNQNIYNQKISLFHISQTPEIIVSDKGHNKCQEIES